MDSAGLMKRAGRWLSDYLTVVKAAFVRAGDDNITILASGMVYSTLIAIVPCITFLSAFLSVFGGLENFSYVVGQWLMKTFGEKEGAFVLEKITLFSRNAMSLGIFGLVTFIISASLLAVKIDGIINSVFRTHHQGYGIMKRYGKILIFIIVMTVFIAVTLSLSQSIRNDVYSHLGAGQEGNGTRVVLKEGVQYVLMFCIFFFLLHFVPDVKVSFPASFSGSLFGTVLMASFYQIFTRLILSTVKLSVIYGTLSSILLVLIYFYVVWYIIILSAEVTFIRLFRPEGEETRGHVVTPQRELEEGLRIMIETARSFNKGEGGISVMLLSSRSGVTYLRAVDYLETLENAGLIRVLGTASRILSKPASSISVGEIVDALFSGKEEEGSEYILLFRKNGLEGIRGKLLSDLL